MQSQIILELGARAVVVDGIVRIVVVAVARRISIVVVAATISTIVGVVGSSRYDLSQIYIKYPPYKITFS